MAHCRLLFMEIHFPHRHQIIYSPSNVNLLATLGLLLTLEVGNCRIFFKKEKTIKLKITNKNCMKKTHFFLNVSTLRCPIDPQKSKDAF